VLGMPLWNTQELMEGYVFGPSPFFHRPDHVVR